MREKLEQAANRVIADYIQDNAPDLKNIEFSEKQIEITLDDGVTVIGRIDLVRRIDTGETTIVDLKSKERAQPEEVTETQLHIYALGSANSPGVTLIKSRFTSWTVESGNPGRSTRTLSATRRCKCPLRRLLFGPECFLQIPHGRSVRRVTICACAPSA